MSRPRATAWIGWALALLAIVLFTRLGMWQSARAQEKAAMLEAAAQVLQARRAVPLAQAADPARARSFDWAQGRGRFDARPALLLDHQQRAGRVGVRTYRVFVPEDGAPLLVDLGWRALPGTRELPATPRIDGVFELRGLLAPPPSTGLALGAAIQDAADAGDASNSRDPAATRDAGDAWLLARMDMPAIAARTGLVLAPRVLRLDPALPLGYDRDLELLANTLTPDKHRGYALQWFALALAVFVTACVLTLRRKTP